MNHDRFVLGSGLGPQVVQATEWVGLHSTFVIPEKRARGAAQKLALSEKLKARAGFAGEDRAVVLKVERMLRTFAATGSD